MLQQFLKSLRPVPQPGPDMRQEYIDLCERTRARQVALSERMKAEGRHVLAGYKPPKDTDLARTFKEARAAMRKSQIHLIKRSK